MIKMFDPFNDRSARDIRNSLSKAFVDQLTRQPGADVDREAKAWLAKAGQRIYLDFINDRRLKYGRLLTHIESLAIRDPRLQAVELWNGGLFFELHELLETVWHEAHGDERTGLKGLIQAAGAYVHWRRGKPKAANGLARRARTNLKAGMSALGFVANLDALLACLENPADTPPVLIAASRPSRPR